MLGRGEWDGNAVDFFNGSVDEVHVVNRALTAQEVAALADLDPGTDGPGDDDDQGDDDEDDDDEDDDDEDEDEDEED